MDAAQFGARLRELREAAGLTQKQLAEKSGLSQGGIAYYEQGKREPMVSAVGLLADALGVTCLEFFVPPAERTPPARGRPTKPIN